jgi:hypothetical protein
MSLHSDYVRVITKLVSRYGDGANAIDGACGLSSRSSYMSLPFPLHLKVAEEQEFYIAVAGSLGVALL